MAKEKRVCLLTGAGGLLGNAFCAAYAHRYDIAAVYHRRAPEAASQDKQAVDPLAPSVLLPENAHPVFVIQADLAEEGAAKRVVELALARFSRIDCLINNAGAYLPYAMIDPRAAEQATKQFHINAIVPLLVAQQTIGQYWRYDARGNRENNRNIVNISSIGGMKIYKYCMQGPYAASKAALNYLTWHMADEYGLRVNALAPNSFPSIIPTESVVHAIAHMDESNMNGAVRVMDKDHSRYLTAADL